MTERLTQNVWRRWDATVTGRAARLLRELRLTEPPIPLVPLLQACRCEVVFRPLIVNGATAPTVLGFRVYCRCDAHEAAGLHQQLIDSEDMGRFLPPRTRFTLAHEIAHTFFFDERTSPPRNKLEPTNDAAVAKLERLCDRGAHELLMPRGLLEADLADCDPFAPGDLLEVSRRFGVSINALLIRMTHVACINDAGAAFHVVRANGEFLIEGALITPSLTRLFPKPHWRASLASLALPTFELSPVRETHQLVVVSTKRDPVRLELRCYPLVRSGGFLITLRTEGAS